MRSRGRLLYLPGINGGRYCQGRAGIATLGKRSSFSQSNMDLLLPKTCQKAFDSITVDTWRVARPPNPKNKYTGQVRLTSPAYIREVQDVNEARRFNGHVIDRPA